MVNTEQLLKQMKKKIYYNILNIVVNTEPMAWETGNGAHYNILNIVVNTEHHWQF